MKKLMYIAAALLVLVGCNKNSQENKENAPQNLVTITGGIDFSAQDGPNKVVAKPGWEDVEDGEEVGFVWEEGDEIAVMSTDFSECHKFMVSKIFDDGATAEFTGEPLSGGMENFMVEYPYELGEADCISLELGSEWFKTQQYTGKFKPVGFTMEGSNNSFTLNSFLSMLDLSLKGNAKLSKIEYAIDNTTIAAILFGEEGLQLTDEPKHVTFAPNGVTDGKFKLSFYDTEEQLILEKEVTAHLGESYYNKIFSFPPLEVNAAN